MQTIYEKNIQAFMNAYPIKRKELEKQMEKQEYKVELCESYNGVPVLYTLDKSNRKLFFNGMYNPDGYFLEKMNAWGKINSDAPIIIVGMENLRHIRRIIKKRSSQNQIIIYEPTMDVFSVLMREIDMTDLFKEESLVWCIEGINAEVLMAVIEKILSFEKLFIMKHYVSPLYSKLYYEKVSGFLKKFKKHVENLLVSMNTKLRFTDVYAENDLRNIRYLYHAYHHTQFAGSLRKKIPAIIVSAGPSLNKNIEDLRMAQGKACIIAVDTAIKPLLNRGIKPDFFAVIDGKKPTELIMHEDIDEIPLLSSLHGAHGVMEYHNGKKIFDSTECALEKQFWQKLEEKSVHSERLSYVPLPTGGSVACTAFSFALEMEPSEIILVGQDLALTGNRTHADGTFHDKMPEISEQEKNTGIIVDEIHGGKVITRSDFKYYLDWFENRIAELKNTVVIDATEGGALIHGSRVMTLRSAIKKYCNRSFDAQKLWDNIPEMLDNGAKQAFVEEYHSVPKGFARVEKEAKKAEKMYRERIERVKNGISERDFNEAIKEIAKSTEFLKEDKYALCVSESLERLDRLIRTNLYNENEDVQEERILLLKQGEIYCNHMAFVAKVLRNGSRELIKEFPVFYEPQPTDDPLELMQMALEEAGVK